MGKITLAVLVLAIALGVYWFWWSDQGANNPITVEGTISYAGTTGLSGPKGSLKVDFTLYAVPNKLRSTSIIQRTMRISNIIRLDKREMYIIDEKRKVYALEEFDLVDSSETELKEMEETWPSWLKRTADWHYIGTGEEKRFSNKQIMSGLPKELLEKSNASKQNPFLTLIQSRAKDVKAEIWFTPDTRLGRRYFGMLNKMARIRSTGQSGAGSMFDFTGIAGGKRFRLKYVNLDLFPFPMKAYVTLGPMEIKMEVKKLSRRRIPRDVFEIPSGYKEVSINEMM